MNIVFRADANHNIGMGHIMRCLSIADACKSTGHKATFIIAEKDTEDIIKKRGFDVTVLSSDYTKMDEEIGRWPQSEPPDAIFIDSYYVTQSYLASLKEKYKSTLVYIDDLQSFPYPVDILVNYNIYSTELEYKKLYHNSEYKTPSLLLGPKYAPLRSAFRNIPSKKQKENVAEILISTGGSDEFHLALKLVHFLLKQKQIKYRYHILMGALNQDKAEIKTIAAGNTHIVLHENVSDMKTLIRSMDIVVSAAGSTLYEVCACGVPLITYVIADNQIPGAQTFGKQNLAVNVGDLREPKTIATNTTSLVASRTDVCKIIFDTLEKISYNYEQRVNMGLRMQKTIDGRGANRIVKALKSSIPEHKGKEKKC
jgi:UDP-2,4-diacetamido-2,4,6-trideoxy-beta-L-altropyranose hydrolase